MTRAVPLALCLAAQASAQDIPMEATPVGPDPASTAREPVGPRNEDGSLLSGFSQVLGQSGGLTADEAARRAAETSVQAAVKREQVVIAESTRERVFWEAAPLLTLSAQATRLSEVEVSNIGDFVFPPPPQNNYLLNARLTVPLSDYLLRTVNAMRGANANRSAAELEERAERVTAASNARLSYYDWVRARLEAVVAAQAVGQASAQLSRMRALHAVGRAAEADLLQAQAFEADAQLASSQSQTQQAIAEERLRVAIHAAPEESLRVGENVLAEFPEAAEVRSLDELYREGARQRLEIQALAKNLAALESVGSVEGSRALPRLDAVGNVTYANPNPRVFPQEERWSTTWDVGLSLVWVVNDVGTAGTRARSVRAQAAQIEQQQNAVREALRLEVVSALGALNQARLNVTTAEQGERAAAAAFTARERLREQGMGTALELLQAETTRIRARLNVINAHISLRVARVQLDHAVGRDAGTK